MTTKPAGGDENATRWRQSDLVSDFPGKRYLNDCLLVCDGKKSAKFSLRSIKPTQNIGDSR